MQKLDVFEGVKSAVSGFTGSVSSMIGLGDDSQIKVDNVNKNHSIIDVNITGDSSSPKPENIINLSHKDHNHALTSSK
jgi:hypothetical protein